MNPLGAGPSRDGTEETLEEMAEATLLRPPPGSQLVPARNGGMMFRSFKLTPVSLEIYGALTKKDWREMGAFLKQAGAALRFWIGDWVNAGVHQWGEMYDEAIAVTGLQKKTLENVSYIAGSVESSRRREQLSFKHHAEVAAQSPDLQDYWLDKAADQGLSSSALRAAIKSSGKPPDAPPPAVGVDLFVRFKRLWKGVQDQDVTKISRADLDDVERWCAEVRSELDRVEAEMRRMDREAMEATEQGYNHDLDAPDDAAIEEARRSIYGGDDGEDDEARTRWRQETHAAVQAALHGSEEDDRV